MASYRNVSVKRELADYVEKFIKGNPHLGYRSIAQFMEDSTRKRLEALHPIKVNNVKCPDPLQAMVPPQREEKAVKRQKQPAR